MSQAAVQSQGSAKVDTEFDIELRKVYKVFNGEPAVSRVDLTIQRGEFFSILGPSGCGKTTTLRMIAGFETPTAGEVLIRGQLMTNVPPYLRPVNTVFQSYALFSHLTVKENVAFGLRLKRRSRAEVEERVNEALKLVKMEPLATRFPAQLSGGQQQRVALARALVNRPAVVLLDEPLGALDLKLRKQMQVELSTLHRDLGVTFIMVTHDQEEAMSLSDRIAVMHEGKVEQLGTPQEIYEHPATPFVASFIGDTNLFRGQITNIDRSILKIQTESGLPIMVQPVEPWNADLIRTKVVVSIRPEKVYVSFYPPDIRLNCFEGRLRNVMYLGTHVHYLIELPTGDRLTVLQPNTAGALPDSDIPIYVYWATTDCLALLDR
ncbi:spermidine/putrescine ABC transporter ATP-binding protein [Leptolyngbya sp. 'hensonii']|uniref:ABC transporter ATP-binding protein n=1 Tax=Leptolyngbya sp. 'hensonii' TaxID=1922337 RepID=UPI00094FEF5F|nr:ABC transporter ATP-binding protein [Leptolyngbya sp. 'hensonii']OLP18332.1 spermidine/putrescine ABC transporter ATP-binding protein [Leptolyngbya sp. 'hensonii']